MRKGVADFWRNFQVDIAANRRYLDALAAAPLKGEGIAGRPVPAPNQTWAHLRPLQSHQLI